MTENQEKEMFTLLRKCANGVQRLEDEMKGVKTDFAGLKTDVAGLKTDVAGLKTDVAGLKTDVAEIKTDVAELKAGQARIENQFEVISRSLDSLAGDSLKTKSRIQILEERIN